MKADVQIHRIHKRSKIGLKEFVSNVKGVDEIEIFNSPKIQEAINNTFGKQLKISVMPFDEIKISTDFYVIKKTIKQQNNIYARTNKNFGTKRHSCCVCKRIVSLVRG